MFQGDDEEPQFIKVLIVEDEEAICEEMKELFRDDSCECVEAQAVKAEWVRREM